MINPLIPDFEQEPTAYRMRQFEIGEGVRAAEAAHAAAHPEVAPTEELRQWPGAHIVEPILRSETIAPVIPIRPTEPVDDRMAEAYRTLDQFYGAQDDQEAS